MKKYIWISLLFLLGCGSRKTDTHIDKVKENTETKSEAETQQETTAETTTESTYKISEDIFSFGITPIGDTPAKFLFMFDGKKIEGETSGVLNFGNQKKQSEGKTVTKQIIHTTYKTVTSYQTKTTYKSFTKDKSSERKAYPWYWIVLGTILIWELANLAVNKVWKLYKPKIL